MGWKLRKTKQGVVSLHQVTRTLCKTMVRLFFVRVIPIKPKRSTAPCGTMVPYGPSAIRVERFHPALTAKACAIIPPLLLRISLNFLDTPKASYGDKNHKKDFHFKPQSNLSPSVIGSILPLFSSVPHGILFYLNPLIGVVSLHQVGYLSENFRISSLDFGVVSLHQVGYLSISVRIPLNFSGVVSLHQVGYLSSLLLFYCNH